MEVIFLADSVEDKLIQDAVNGSNFALSQLLQQNYKIVYKYLIKLTLDSQTAADITQDCMLKVIDKINYYNPEKSAFSTWMITIARNLWIDECRREKRKFKYIKQNSDIKESDPIDSMIRKDEILSALKNVDNKKRVPVLLKYADGYSYDEIAKLLKIPIGTVKSRISNGIKFLKKEMSHNG